MKARQAFRIIRRREHLQPTWAGKRAELEDSKPGNWVDAKYQEE